MSHDTPQPGQKTGWFENEHGVLGRDWDEDDERIFMDYCEAFSGCGRDDLVERYNIQKLFEPNPDALLNRMAGRLSKLAGTQSHDGH